MSDTVQKESRVGVVGAGSIGLLFAVKLGIALGGVTLVTRRDDVSALIGAEGVWITQPGADAAQQRDLHLASDRIVSVHPDGLAPESCALVVVACRSGESAYALGTARRLASRTGTVLVVQNGLRAWELARRDGLRCICGATYEIAHPVAANRVAWTRVGRTEVAAPGNGRGGDADVERVAALFEAASMSLRIAPSEADAVWRKVVLTLPNWLAAAVGAPLHAVVESAAALQILQDLVVEIASVAAVDGVELSADWAAEEFAALRGSGSVGSAFTALAAGQDLEVVDICRSVIDRAGSCGLATPRTEALMRLAEIQAEVFAVRENPKAASS
jgi:2-dehydropantoate 2-reductase